MLITLLENNSLNDCPYPSTWFLTNKAVEREHNLLKYDIFDFDTALEL